MYTIKRAAELTGISVATLRAWERRYGVVSPQRSDSGYRLYGPDDVRTLAIMNSLVNEGWSAREAAAETISRLSSRDPGEGGEGIGGPEPSNVTHLPDELRRDQGAGTRQAEEWMALHPLGDPSGERVLLGSEGAQAELQNEFHKSLTLPEAEVLTLKTLKQVMEEKLDSKNVQLASVTKDKGFRIYTDEEMAEVVGRLPTN